MAWLHGVLALLCAAIGGLHLVRVARPRRNGPGRERVLEAAHAAMGLGMAGMYSPVGDPVPGPVWAAVFLVCGAWFAALLARSRSLAALGGEALHVLVGCAAMLFMLGADHRAAGPGGGQHAAHAPGAPELATVASAAALVLAAYFCLHALRCADRYRAARAPAPAAVPAGAPAGPPGPASPGAPPVRPGRVATLPALAHLLMTVAMATMLVGMI